MKQDGASALNISEIIEIRNLKDYVYQNGHGLYEIKLDTSRLLTIGSNSAVKKFDNVFTSHKFTLNKYNIYKKSFLECMKEYKCHKNFDNEAAIRNAIHTNIWTNKSTSNSVKDKQEMAFQDTYRQGIKDEMYEYYHKFFTATYL